MTKFGIATDSNTLDLQRTGVSPARALRAMLLGTAAAGAMLVTSAGGSLAACQVVTGGVVASCGTTANNDPGEKVLNNGTDATATAGATAGGGISGAVAPNVPAINTSGNNSEGLLLQSNGGNGYSPGASLTPVGDPGTDGANGGNITFSNGAAITTTGDGSHGISAQSQGGNGGDGGAGAGMAGLGQNGDGGAGGNGAAINLTNTGAIDVSGAGSNGIQAISKGGAGGSGSTAGANGDGGNVTITNSAAITSTNGDGINAHSDGVNSGAVKITNSAAITTESGTGIKAESNGTGGTVEVDNTVLGKITSFINGIFGSANGDVTVTNSGSVTTEGDLGIEPDAGAGDAISVRSATGKASVVNAGTVNATGTGIAAEATSSTADDTKAATVTNNGHVTAAGNGIVAKSSALTANVGNSGTISAEGSGIVAESETGAVTVDNGLTGKITALVDGIIAQITGSNAETSITVTNNGEVGNADAPVEGRGIVASNNGSGDVTVSGSGSVTSVGAGISADATTGKVSVTAGKVTTTGESSNGIDAKAAAVNGADGADAVASLAAGFLGVDATAGSNGGTAGEVKVTSNGDVTATNKGIVANSAGGAGGNGGSDVDGVANGIGGDGGAGGNGSAVGVTANASVTANDTGIQAASTGGNGGNGGTGFDTDGAGGQGGNGGDVTVETTSAANVTSTTSAGIQATSAGGNGGTGGTAGDGGNGGFVGVTHAGKIVSEGDGINAASTGGGSDATGGNGGYVSVDVAKTGEIKSASGKGISATSTGGEGGTANGTSDDVDVSMLGKITSYLTGIFASSNDGAVTVDVTDAAASIKTTGVGANGIDASSTSGGVSVTNKGAIDATGEGIGATTATGAVTVTNTATGAITSVNTGINAQITSANAGTNLSVTNDGKVTTTGGEATGISAINIGAGNVTVGGAGTVETKGAYSTGIYAEATSGQVSVTAGKVTTVGTVSTGIDAYAAAANGANGADAVPGGMVSVPGDPATAGATGFNAGNMTITANGAISATGDGSKGISANSYGGAGGNGGSDVDRVANGIGGDGGAGGNGSAVGVTANASVTANDTGIQAASTGGNGGNGGTGFDTDGAGGDGGNGGDVTVTANMDIKAGSVGVSATSTGGGGNTSGIGGNVTVETKGKVDAQNHGIVALSGNSNPGQGALSDGGIVKVTASGGITATGAGIVAESRGSGSGEVTVKNSGSINSSVQSIAAYSAGSNVTVNNAGDVKSQYNGVYAIEVTSTGVGGTATVTNSGKVTGAGSGIGAKASNVDLTSSNDVSGATFYGINANASGTSSVDITGGTVTGKQAAINFEGGGTHALSNAGNIVAATGGLALKGQGDVSVENTGTVTGDIDLARNVGGVSQFDNLSGGVLNTGSSLKLHNGAIVPGGPNGTLTNSGVVSPGGNGTVQTTAITGNFEQKASGTLVVDADWNTGKSDRLDVTGTAVLDGTVKSNTMNLIGGQGGLTKSFTIITAGNGATLASSAVSPSDTAAVDYSLLKTDDNTITLDARVNFLGVQQGGILGLTSNQSSVGGALNSIISAGGTAGQNLAFLPTMLTETAPADLAVALQQLAPQGEASQVGQVVATAGAFAQQLRSCRVNGEASDNERFIREGQCVWARISGRHFNNDGDGNSPAFSERGTFVSGGVQLALGGNWKVGGGAGYEQVDASAAASKADTNRYHFGGVLKYNPGPWLFTAALSGGFGSSDAARSIKIGSLSSVATSSYDSDYLSGRVTGAYLINLGGSLYAKPDAEVAITNYTRDAFIEKASGGTALSVAGSDETVVSVSTGVEIGSEMALGAGGVMRPFVRGGVTWFDTDTFSTLASFADAGPGSASFAITSTSDNVVADVAAGLDLIAPGGTALRLQYDGRFGEQTQQHGGTAKVSVPF